MESYLRVNLLGPDPRLIKKEFTGSRSHKGWETHTHLWTGLLESNRPVHKWILQRTIFVTQKFRKPEDVVVFIKVLIHVIGCRRKRPRYRFQIICGLLYACANVLNIVVENAVLILISFILTYGYTVLQSCSHNYITWIV